MRPGCQESRPPSNAIRVLVGRPTAYNHPAVSPRARRPPAYRDRSNAFAHLFDAIREGAFVGSVDRSGADPATYAVNPHLKSIFGYPADIPDGQVDPFAPDRFIDPAARSAFLGRLKSDGAVSDYLLRMRRIDGTIAED